ncbi:hypothetical protein [Fischerella thermalis]|nr:hypothetical protein [Fischerella thermalis]
MSKNLSSKAFEPIFSEPLLTLRSLKRYIYSRSAPLNLENLI